MLYYSLTGYKEDCRVSGIGGLGEEYWPEDGRGHGPRQGGKSCANVGTGGKGGGAYDLILNDWLIEWGFPPFNSIQFFIHSKHQITGTWGTI